MQVSADLRTSIFQSIATEEQVLDHVTDRSSSATIQAIVDDIVCAMARVTNRSDFANAEELITKLRSAISTNLQTSALPLLVKFRDLEVVLNEPFGQRYVSNALLNPDGSERYEDINVQDAQRSPIIVTGGNRISDSAMYVCVVLNLSYAC